METKRLTCVECPMGCQIEVDMNGDNILEVRGNSCPRGKTYAENEVVCPVRVLTTTVRANNGTTMVCVKTDKPIKKSEIFEIMKKINAVKCDLPVKVGDVLVENIADGANLVATGNFD